VRPNPLTKTEHLVANTAAHIQDLVTCVSWTELQHALLYLLNQWVSIGAVQPLKCRVYIS
jgi:hypothetical protein